MGADTAAFQVQLPGKKFHKYGENICKTHIQQKISI
jgi:hypothetical protein